MPTPLLLLPGILCDGASWGGIETVLGPRAVTIADYGTRDSLASMAEDALAASPARVAVAGHSMGGRVAMEMVRLAPERIAGVALLDTATHPRKAGEAGEREARERYALLDLARAEGMRAMARRWAEPMVHPARRADAALMESIYAMVARKTPAIQAAQIRALLDRSDAGPVLAGIRCPALVLCGREDAWAPLAGHEAIAAAIPGARLAVVERCGHMAPMERPAEVAAAFRDWLAAVDAAEAFLPAAPMRAAAG